MALLLTVNIFLTIAASAAAPSLPLDPSKVCNVKPLGHGRDDTTQVQAAIDKCTVSIVFNTDGIDTYRSDKISMLNWDITCGDDCLAIKGNSTNILARNITCHGGTGIAVGSLGQYVNMRDDVRNVLMEDIQVSRHPNSAAQPLLANGIYFKSWDGSVNGAPPTGGGGANGTVSNFTARNVVVEGADVPLHLFQTNLAQPGDLPSKLTFEDLHFVNWTGFGDNKTVADIECSPAVGCHDITFENFHVQAAPGEKPHFICQNTFGVRGLDDCTQPVRIEFDESR